MSRTPGEKMANNRISWCFLRQHFLTVTDTHPDNTEDLPPQHPQHTFRIEAMSLPSVIQEADAIWTADPSGARLKASKTATTTRVLLVRNRREVAANSLTAFISVRPEGHPDHAAREPSPSKTPQPGNV